MKDGIGAVGVGFITEHLLVFGMARGGQGWSWGLTLAMVLVPLKSLKRGCE